MLALAQGAIGNLIRILSPNLKKASDNGNMSKAIKASNEFPQPNPRASYIEGPANGKTAPSRDRNTVLAAAADAACAVKASTR